MISEAKHKWRSFAGGEIAEELYARPDLVKNQTGLKRCSNFAITPQGSVIKRTGSEFIAVARDNPFSQNRFETFYTSTDIAYLLQFSNTLVDVYSLGLLAATETTPYAGAQLYALSFAQINNDFTMVHTLYDPHVLRLAGSGWTVSQILFNQVLAAPASPMATANEITSLDAGDPRITYSYKITALDANSAEGPASAAATAANILRIAGDNNTITWSAVTNAVKYNIYGARGAGAHGFIGSATGLSFVDDNINPDQFTQPSEVLVQFVGATTLPSVVAFHEQRAIFAATGDDQQSFWASGLAGFGYFKASVPPQDDQAFTYQLSSKKRSSIRHILALRDLLFFTNNGVHRVYSNTGEAFSPTTVSAIEVSAHGAAQYVRPQEAGNAILFPVDRGYHLHEMKYDGSGEGYIDADLSLIAPHLIDGYYWVKTDFQRSPFQVWWGLRSDGVLVGLTYVGEQQVHAWFTYTLPGAVIQTFAVVPEGQYDALYVQTKRIIDGTQVYYIERLHDPLRPAEEKEDGFFLDCGITYSGDATDTITGLDHLEGEEVYALANGQPMGPFTVDSGQITIDEEATLVHVGKLYAAELETVPLAYAVEGEGMGDQKNVAAVHLRLKRSDGIEAGPSLDNLRPLPAQLSELIGGVEPLRSGVEEIVIDTEWTLDGSVAIRQESPVPATITGFAVDFAAA